MLSRTFACFVFAVSLNTCQRPTDAEIELAEGRFSATATGEFLVLRNSSAIQVNYIAIERETAALYDPYFDPRQWPAVEPGGEETIPYDGLIGYTSAAEEAFVYWWTPEDSGRFTVTLH